MDLCVSLCVMKEFCLLRLRCVEGCGGRRVFEATSTASWCFCVKFYDLCVSML